MSGLMLVSLFVTNEPPPPSIAPSQNDSLSKVQVTEQPSEWSRQFGVFLGTPEGKIRKNPDAPSKQFGRFFVPDDFFVPDTQITLETVTANELDSRFIITTNRQETLTFIEANDLLHVLLRSEKHINDAFGESSLKTLTIVEDDEGYRTLFCLIVFSGTLAQAQEALGSFDRNWWLKNARKFGSKLNFDFELV